MHKLYLTCMVGSHYPNVIEYVCVHPQCYLSRFLCSKCEMGNSHRHENSYNSHILNNNDFCDKINYNLSKAKGK